MTLNKEKIFEALEIIGQEVNNCSEGLDTNMAVYQIYCTMNHFLAEWAKKNIFTEEGYKENEKTKDVLLDFIQVLTNCMKRYSEIVRKAEEDANRQE